MTEFRELALSTCDGRVLPTACSGLSIASRFPFEVPDKLLFLLTFLSVELCFQGY